MARVVVAMSGGVDSSVTAALLVEQGHEVIGVHMKLHDAAPGSEPGTCCGLDDAIDARRVADRLGIPFYVMNLREAFQKAVIDDLTDTYLAGRTPNPCIQCNGVLKFKVLLARAMALGATHLATGHYARIEDGALHRHVEGCRRFVGQQHLRVAGEGEGDHDTLLLTAAQFVGVLAFRPLGQVDFGKQA